MLGATKTVGEGGEVKFSGNDNAPFGGFGFICCKQVDNIKKFQGVFYPRVKAVMQGDEFASKGDGITLTGGKLKLTASTAKSGDWKIVSDLLETEAAAKTWVDGKVKAAAGG